MPLKRKLTVEDAPKFNFQLDVIRKEHPHLNKLWDGAWRGQPVRVLLSTYPGGSYVRIGDRVWTVVSRETPYGCRWLIEDSTGKRVNFLVMAPDGRVGSRHELKLGYRCERGSHRSRRAWARMKAIKRIEGVEYPEKWIKEHAEYKLRKKPKRMRWVDFHRRLLRLNKLIERHTGASPANAIVSDRATGCGLDLPSDL